MGAAIWSAGTATLRSFPGALLRALLPQPRHVDAWTTGRSGCTVRGGSARYVEKLTAPFRERIRLRTPVESVRRTPAGVIVKAAGCEAERFDRVFFACHSDQALRLLADAEPTPSARCSAPSATSATTCCCTPTRSVLPRRRLAWAAWNYHVLDRAHPNASPSPTT